MSDTAIQKQQDTVQIPERARQLEQQSQTVYTPLVDIVENDEAFLFQADLPGASPADVDVSYDNNVLTIAARCSRVNRQASGTCGASTGWGISTGSSR